MTLNTSIYILDEVDPMEVYNFVNKHLLKVTNPITLHRPYKDWSKDKGYTEHPDIMDLDNEVGQGFDAWYMSKYRKSGEPLYPEDHYEDWSVGEDDEEDLHLTNPACFMELSFDTAYGYVSKVGGCSQLHTTYIIALHDWLEAKGVRIKWQNEFTGEIHDGLDGLEEFGTSGEDARKWFKSIMPGVIASIAAEYSEGKEKQS